MNNPRAWVALAAALALHALLLAVPLTRLSPPAETVSIELDLRASVPEPETKPEPPVEPAPPSEPPREQPERVAEAIQPDSPPAQAEPAPGRPAATPRQSSARSEVILSRQYISEEPVIDRIFGRPLEAPAMPQVDFRIPQRTDMLTLLNRPVPDLPFAYTPGLVHFAYAPGVKGDLQRFWDVITPEFGWRTNNGTEIRCVLMLVVMGCGWK